ncbi:undecaprenyl-diphosphatase UppP [Amorphus orientalis]|uniref:Undecaprenyl-diphosphatase n=1 Tax=Amorphus orientalis TaxID=649198 RepID=A0AAE3VSM6_9HYPH|nr:undecaprenyl-diphosphatase UppP [Amorphus orientalis]
MEADTIISAVLLGFVEGLTEFIPVSSTGHLLLLGHFLGFESSGKTFEVLIQLGAILAILSVYFGRLWALLTAAPSDPRARRFFIGIIVAFLPAAFAGVALHGFIKTVLFESPTLICVTLIVGGVILLVLDRMPSRPRYRDAYAYPVWLALAIGCFQTLALVPGVSRSGATIGGALVLGTDKRSAAEFSFFLAMPTMAGAFVYDLYKNRNVISMDDAVVIAIGFVTAFIAAVIVVRSLLDFVSRHGFAPFAYWRIAVGTIGLVALFLTAPATTPTTAAPEPDASDGSGGVTATPSIPAPPGTGPTFSQPSDDAASGSEGAIVPTPDEAGQRAEDRPDGMPQVDSSWFDERFQTPPQVELTRPPETGTQATPAPADQPQTDPPLPPRKP